ncbi:response regulator [Rubellimicrobium roseum]|uniref:Response regulator n=1 Tax=Rubellimicrobium roseum TaxID=687525 RepID=A0A5C4N4H7_9RHOB|nr:response regulator [Rubellimicrobium roseum]TNC59358.1 response regulator [Rubellimicrobium roseum]
MASPKTLAGRCILIVEDDFFIADDFAAIFEGAGATVVGPAASLSDAMDLIERTERLDGALLDMNLQGEMAYTLADALRVRGVPVVFATGYDRGAIPERYADIPICEKPVDPQQVAQAISG